MEDRIYHSRTNSMSFIKEALEDFTHIVDSKYITKSEFTKFNKFFKNLITYKVKRKRTLTIMQAILIVEEFDIYLPSISHL